MTDTLDSLDLDLLPDASQTALIRLNLYVTGQVHALLLDVQDAGVKAIQRNAGGDEAVPAEAYFGIMRALNEAWDTAFPAYERLLNRALRHAAAIPYGALAVQHDAFFGQAAGTATEAVIGAGRALTADLDDLLKANRDRTLGGRKLSQRLWRLDRDARQGMDAAIIGGIARNRSADELAADLEQFLGAGAACPRWTTQRLALTPGQIAAGDLTGLVSGSPCDARGVAYNALRLARTELSAVHQSAAARVAERTPWVSGVQIRLSGSHPKPDICDVHAGGGPNNDGIYPKGDQPMPPYHANCMCYQAAVLINPADVAQRITTYLSDGRDAALESYRSWLGVARDALALLRLAPIMAGALTAWLTDEPNDMEDTLGSDPD